MEQIFTARLTNGGFYHIVADSQEHAMHELDRMGLSYAPSYLWVDVEPGDAVYIPSKYVGTINYTTGEWSVDLPGEIHVDGQEYYAPLKPSRWEHDFSPSDPMEEGCGRSFRMRDDGAGNIYVHEMGPLKEESCQ